MVVSQEYGFHLECSAGEGWSKPSATWCMVGFHPEQALMTEQGRKNTKLCQKIMKRLKKWKRKKCCDKPKGRKNLPLMVLPSYQFEYYSCSKRPVCTNEMCDFVIPTLYFLEPSLVVFLSAKILWSGGFPPQMKTVFGLFLLSSLVVFPPLPLMSLLWCGLTSNEILHR